MAWSDAPASEASVVAGFGRHVLVRTHDGEVRPAVVARRALQLACGDRVSLKHSGSHTVVDALRARQSVFARASSRRTKVVAANITQVVVLVACEPPYSDELLCRFIVAAEHEGLPVVIALNKVDLAAQRAAARVPLEPFRDLGYPVVEVSAHHDADPLRTHLTGQRSLLVGQSGMGKSTLVRALVPEADVRIGAISRFLGTGRQTTTVTRLYEIDAKAEIIDSPGVSAFGLGHLRPSEIEHGFREIGAYRGQCRFPDCRHLAEPGCALATAAHAGRVHPRRVALYQRIMRLEGHA